MSKIINNKAPRPDEQRYDRVEIITVPRWKESEMSGDEYRISAQANLYYKGNLVREVGFNDVETAIRYLDGALVFKGEPEPFTPRRDDSYLCDQESCAEIVDVKHKRLEAFTDRGEETKLYDFALYRVFCNKHKGRGDCGRDDADHNYEQVEFLPEEKEVLERLRNGDEL